MDTSKRPESLKDNIGAILNGTDDEKKMLTMRYFFIADTPQLMKELGLNGDYFCVRYGVISRHNGKDTDHDLTQKDWLSLIDKITEPFAIAKHNDGYNLYVNIQVNGKWVMAGVIVKKSGKKMFVNKVRTVFGARQRKDTDFIYKSEKITPAQEAFLNGTNFRQ
jgi:hypothetical protein